MNDHKWISCRDALPPRLEWVYMRDYSDKYYLAYRSMLGNWRYKSGLRKVINDGQFWRPLTVHELLELKREKK